MRRLGRPGRTPRLRCTLACEALRQTDPPTGHGLVTVWSRRAPGGVMARLTRRVVEGAKASGRDRFLWDESLPGFGVRVYASGRRVYLARYRNRAGRVRYLVLGVHGAVTSEQARRAAAG